MDTVLFQIYLKILIRIFLKVSSVPQIMFPLGQVFFFFFLLTMTLFFHILGFPQITCDPPRLGCFSELTALLVS